MVLSEFLQRIKSALGVDGSQGRQESPGQQQPAREANESSEQRVGVTVEREPATASEDAVKGTETASEPEPSTDAVEDEVETAEEAPTDEASEAEPETTEEDQTESEKAQESEDDATADDDLGTDESVDMIKGIGPTYAERLGEAGVDTVADLAHADAAELAEETDISETRLSNWIEKARHR